VTEEATPLVVEHVEGSTLRVYADGPGLFRWEAVQYRPIAMLEIYAAGIGRLEGHETSQEAALQAARRYEPLLGITDSRRKWKLDGVI
jgi:hypothetical protein